MRLALAMLLFAAFSGLSKAADANDGKNLQEVCSASNSSTAGQLPSVACHKGRVYAVNYDRRATRIVLAFNGRKISLQQFPRNFDPSLVGSDSLIGFLPDLFQVYRTEDILIYVSAVRTSGGAGRGECGAGSEIYFNFLDVSLSVPKTKSRILIGSCSESIELMNQDIAKAKIGDVAVVENKLTLHFLNYRNLEGSPTATVTPDFKGLVFQ